MSTGTSEPVAAVRIEAPVATVVVVGDIDLATAPALSGCINEVLANLAVARICVDLEQCTFLDSIGLRALVQARTEAADTGRFITLRRPGALVQRVLAATGVRDLFPVEVE